MSCSGDKNIEVFEKQLQILASQATLGESYNKINTYIFTERE